MEVLQSGILDSPQHILGSRFLGVANVESKDTLKILWETKNNDVG